MQNNGLDIPLSSEVMVAVEGTLEGTDYRYKVFPWDVIPDEYLSWLARQLNLQYAILIKHTALHAMTVVEVCGVVQIHILDRLRPTDRFQHAPSHQEVLTVIRQILDDEASIPPEDVEFVKSIQDLEIDSLSVLYASMAIEDRYNIKFPDDGFTTMVTVGDLVVHIINELSLSHTT